MQKVLQQKWHPIYNRSEEDPKETARAFLKEYEKEIPVLKSSAPIPQVTAEGVLRAIQKKRVGTAGGGRTAGLFRS